MEADALVQLGKYGVVGIMLGMLGLIGYTIYLLAQAYKQHQDMFHTARQADTQAKVELARAIQKNTDTMENLISVIKKK